MTDPIELLRRVQTIAVVGATDDPWKPSCTIPRRLQAAGYQVVGVNPTLDEVLGGPSYASVGDVPFHVDLVDVFRRPQFCPDVARDAVAAGAGALWLQQGIRSDEARRIADDAGLDYVEDACTGALVAIYGISRLVTR